ncbi:hypothetical protein [Nocardia brasiliensis]
MARDSRARDAAAAGFPADPAAVAPLTGITPPTSGITAPDNGIHAGQPTGFRTRGEDGPEHLMHSTCEHQQALAATESQQAAAPPAPTFPRDHPGWLPLSQTRAGPGSSESRH